MRVRILLDTNVLFGDYLCDFILRLAGLARLEPMWSEEILDELERNLIAHSATSTQSTREFGIRVVHPDDFLLERITIVSGHSGAERNVLIGAFVQAARSEGWTIISETADTGLLARILRQLLASDGGRNPVTFLRRANRIEMQA